MEQTERILELIRNYKSDVDANIATIDIETMIDKIKLYCNISDIPTTLERPIARELFNTYNVSMQGVKSFTEGDTTVNYANSIDFDNALNNLKQTLFPYRRLYLSPKEVG